MSNLGKLSSGGQAIFVRTDVSDAESVKNLIAKAEYAFGTVHMEERDFDEVISINLSGCGFV